MGAEGSVASDFTTFTGKSWSEYATANPKAAQLHVLDARTMGTLALTIGLLIVLIASNAYRRAEKWSWSSLLVGGGISWGLYLGYSLTVGSGGGLITMIIVGIALLILGLAVPARVIFGGKPSSR